ADTVARLGGDEFAILLPTVASEGGAARLAEKILKALERHFDVEGRELEISASIGIALCPQHGRDWTTLMRRADEAMYTAKKSSKKYAIASPSEAPHRKQAENIVRPAVQVELKTQG